jgi:hypothetical protein
MAQPAARGFRAGGIEGHVTLFDVNDLALFVDYESRSVGHSRVRDQHSVSRRYLPFREIAQQREGSAHLGGKFLLGWGVVGADSEDLSF